MKIAQVAHNYLPHIGGVEFYVKRIIDSLSSKGIQGKVLTTDMDTQREGRKPEAEYFRTSVAYMRNPLSLDFIRHLRKNDYDILHLHSVWFLHSLTAVYFRKKARVIATIHGVYPDNASWKLKFFLRLYKPFAAYVLRKAERIFVYSEIEKEKLKRIFKTPEAKITALPMAINVEKATLDERDKFILFTGRIIPDKNPDILIKAVGQLGSAFKDYKLVFVGAVDEAYREKLISMANSVYLRDQLYFVGQLDPSIQEEHKELMRYYSTAAAFVSIGSWEGQPTRLMEAMQFATPVVAFSAGGTADFVRDGVNGLIIDKLDEAMLAEKLRRILSDRDFARKLGLAARATIEKDYDWRVIFERMYSAYKTPA